MNVKVIVYGYDLQESEQIYKVYCRSNNIHCYFQEAIFVSSKWSPSCIREKIRGYYNDVMNGKIKLLNISKDMFKYFYSNR